MKLRCMDVSDGASRRGGGREDDDRMTGEGRMKDVRPSLRPGEEERCSVSDVRTNPAPPLCKYPRTDNRIPKRQPEQLFAVCVPH